MAITTRQSVVRNQVMYYYGSRPHDYCCLLSAADAAATPIPPCLLYNGRNYDDHQVNFLLIPFINLSVNWLLVN